MRTVARELGLAVAAWLAPFAASIFLFPLKQSSPPLFDSLMGVLLAGSTVLLGCAYLRRTAGRFVVCGARIGLIWMAANWVLDAPMFSAGPMAMGLGQYVADIGLAYLMIPVITIGLGVAAQRGAVHAG
ncbi:MAG: hypothetical protein HYX69_04610 [Planctomycetia bacterium]|nr:hypothetical protein [Planctomycetia bacterium]